MVPFLALPMVLSNSPHPPLSAPRATHNPRYPSQGTSAAATRKAQVTNVEEENYDAAFETCLALGLDQLARNLAVRPDPVTAARAFSRGWDPAFRQAPFEGCLRAVRGKGR